LREKPRKITHPQAFDKWKGSASGEQIMKKTFLATTLLAIAATALAAAADEESVWMQTYYQHPEPEKLPALITSWHNEGRLAENSSARPAIVGFLSQALHDKPALVLPCLEAAEKLPEDERDLIFNAIWLAHTPGGDQYFKGHGLKKFSEKPPPDLDALVVNGPSELDFYLGRFCASGQASCIRPLVGALKFSEYAGAAENFKSSKKTDADKRIAIYDATYQAAMWSLEAYCRQDPKVFAICKDFIDKHVLSAPEEAFLTVVLAKVRPGEVHVKADAVSPSPPKP
jgi:hypothetical protein